MTKQIKVSEETHKKLMTIKEQEQCSSIDEVINWLINQPSNLYNYLKEIERMDKRIHEILDEVYCKDRKLEDLGVSIECCDEITEKQFVEIEKIFQDKYDNIRNEFMISCKKNESPCKEIKLGQIGLLETLAKRIGVELK